MVSLNTTQKRDQRITQSYMKSLNSHISWQDGKTLGSAKAHLPCPVMRPGMTTWCFLLAPPSQTRQRRRKPVGMSPSAPFHNLRSLYSAQMLRMVGELGSPAEPSQPPGLRCAKAQSLVPMVRGGGAGALPLQGLPGSRAGTAAEPALSMCRPSRGSCAGNNPRGQQKTPEVTGRTERGQPGSGEQALLLFIPRIWLFVLNKPSKSPQGG